jgi:trk system potassium uptake protein TrkH
LTIDIRPVGYIIGWLVAALGLAMAVPMLMDTWDGHQNAMAFAVSALLALVAGAGLAVTCAEHRPRALSLRQGFLLTTGSWAVFPAVAGLPLMLGIPHLSFTDAYFEFTSALTASGGTIIVGLDDLPRSVLLWRGMVTWVGGIGVILLAMILLPILNVGGMQVLRNADFNTLGKIMPRAKAIAASIGSVYAVLTLSCCLAYVWAGMDGFDAIVHALSTVATGGMANHDNSFADFSPAAQWIATFFMLTCSLSFVRYVQLARGEPRPLFVDSQIRTFLGIYLGLCAALVLARSLQGTVIDATSLREIAFSLASVITTTGFAATDYSQWGPMAEVVFFCAMMICGCSGSTSGGPKVFRYQLLFSAISTEVARLHSPNLVHTPRYQGVPISNELLDSVIAYFMMFLLSFGVGAVLLSFMGLDPVTAISGALACLSNIGPGLGPMIGPAGTFAPLPDAAKWVCSFLMLVGRLELLTAYVIFTAAFWRG